MCKKNAENRKKQLYTHTGGSKSIARRKYEEVINALVNSFLLIILVQLLTICQQLMTYRNDNVEVTLAEGSYGLCCTREKMVLSFMMMLKSLV